MSYKTDERETKRVRRKMDRAEEQGQRSGKSFVFLKSNNLLVLTQGQIEC